MAGEDEGGIAGWVTDVVSSVGEVGVGLLIALENVFPPIPSEVILPFAGFSAARGDINAVLAWLAATIGALVGAYILYGVGALVGYDRLHHLATRRWFVLFGPADLARGERFFERHGGKVVLLGRCVPLVRSIVSVPAGLDRMPLGRFTTYTVIGSGVWNALFITAGYQLGENYERVESLVAPVSYAVVTVLAVYVAVLTGRNLRRRARRRQVTS